MFQKINYKNNSSEQVYILLHLNSFYFAHSFKNQQRELSILLISWPLIDQVDLVPTLNKFCLLYAQKTDFYGVFVVLSSNFSK